MLNIVSCAKQGLIEYRSLQELAVYLFGPLRFIYIYIYIWLHQVLAAAHRIFDLHRTTQDF